MTKRLLGLSVGLTVLASIPASAANLITNPSFETPTCASGSQCPASDGANLGGWVVNSSGLYPGSTVYLTSTTYSDGLVTFNAGDGQQSLFFAHNDTVQSEIGQSVTTVPGQSYLLNFLLGNPDDGQPNHSDDASVLVYRDGQNIAIAINNLSTPGGINWGQISVPVTASDTTTSFTFVTALGADDSGIDQVSLSPVPVPTPLSLMASALAALGLLRRKKMA